MAKEKGDPNYRMGKETGYHFIKGEYRIAPIYCDQFEELYRKRTSIAQLVNMVHEHAAKDLEQILKSERELWDRISEDIGVEFSDGWVYTRGIVKKPGCKTSGNQEPTGKSDAQETP